MDYSLPVYSRHTSSFTTYPALPSTYTRVHTRTYILLTRLVLSIHPFIHLLTYAVSHLILSHFNTLFLSLRPSAHCIVLPLQISLVSVLGTWQHVGTNRFHYTVYIPLLRRLYSIAYVIYLPLLNVLVFTCIHSYIHSYNNKKIYWFEVITSCYAVSIWNVIYFYVYVIYLSC